MSQASPKASKLFLYQRGESLARVQVDWLTDEEKFLAGVHLTGDKSQSSGNQALTGTQSFSF